MCERVGAKVDLLGVDRAKVRFAEQLIDVHLSTGDGRSLLDANGVASGSGLLKEAEVSYSVTSTSVALELAGFASDSSGIGRLAVSMGDTCSEQKWNLLKIGYNANKDTGVTAITADFGLPEALGKRIGYRLRLNFEEDNVWVLSDLDNYELDITPGEFISQPIGGGAAEVVFGNGGMTTTLRYAVSGTEEGFLLLTFYGPQEEGVIDAVTIPLILTTPKFFRVGSTGGSLCTEQEAIAWTRAIGQYLERFKVGQTTLG